MRNHTVQASQVFGEEKEMRWLVGHLSLKDTPKIRGKNYMSVYVIRHQGFTMEGGRRRKKKGKEKRKREKKREKRKRRGQGGGIFPPILNS